MIKDHHLVVFKWVVTYTACPLRKLTWIAKLLFDTAKVQTNSLITKLFLDFLFSHRGTESHGGFYSHTDLTDLADVCFQMMS